MRKNLLLVLVTILIFLCSCSRDNSNEILLFGDIVFKVHKNESVVVVAPEIKDEYFLYLNDNDFQIPIFKYIECENYKIFIGIPYRISVKDLMEKSVLRQKNVIVDFQSDSVSYYFKKHKIMDTCMTEYAVEINGNSFFVLSVTNNKQISDTIFSYHEFSNRFSCK